MKRSALLIAALVLLGCTAPTDDGSRVEETSAQTGPPAPAAEGAAPVEQQRDPSVYLLAPNRTTLEICVEAEDGDAAKAGDAQASVLKALEAIRGDEVWQASLYRGLFPTVTVGCGRPGRLFQGDESGDIVSTPSRFRAMVYMATSEPSKERVEALPWRVGAEEIFCYSRDNCAEVTKGLYLTDSEINDVAQVKDGLLQAIGLKRPVLAAANYGSVAPVTKDPNSTSPPHPIDAETVTGDVISEAASPFSNRHESMGEFQVVSAWQVDVDLEVAAGGFTGTGHPGIITIPSGGTPELITFPVSGAPGPAWIKDVKGDLVLIAQGHGHVVYDFKTGRVSRSDEDGNPRE